LGARPWAAWRQIRRLPASRLHQHHHTETGLLESSRRERHDYWITAAISRSGRGSCLFSITQTIERAASAPSWYRRNQQHEEIVEANRRAPQIQPVAIQIKSY
jgi:hypothetical protein